MHVTLVQVQVKAQHLADFIEASVQEPGNRRFDVLQQADDPCRFVLYEAYDSAASAAVHKQTAHYAAWRAAVEPWMAAPRQSIVLHGLFPP